MLLFAIFDVFFSFLLSFKKYTQKYTQPCPKYMIDWWPKTGPGELLKIKAPLLNTDLEAPNVVRVPKKELE